MRKIIEDPKDIIGGMLVIVVDLYGEEKTFFVLKTHLGLTEKEDQKMLEGYYDFQIFDNIKLITTDIERAQRILFKEKNIKEYLFCTEEQEKEFVDSLNKELILYEDQSLIDLQNDITKIRSVISIFIKKRKNV